MRSGLTALFQYDHRDVLTLFRSQLLQANGCGQAAGASTDDYDVVFHGLSRAVLRQDFFVCHRGCLSGEYKNRNEVLTRVKLRLILCGLVSTPKENWGGML